MPELDETADAVHIGRIVDEFLDGPAGQLRARESALLQRYPALARELQVQFAVIRSLKWLARKQGDIVDRDQPGRQASGQLYSDRPTEGPSSPEGLA
jgi:hypothetical protein